MFQHTGALCLDSNFIRALRSAVQWKLLYDADSYEQNTDNHSTNGSLHDINVML